MEYRLRKDQWALNPAEFSKLTANEKLKYGQAQMYLEFKTRKGQFNWQKEGIQYLLEMGWIECSTTFGDNGERAITSIHKPRHLKVDEVEISSEDRFLSAFDIYAAAQARKKVRKRRQVSILSVSNER